MDTSIQLVQILLLCFQLWSPVAGGSCWWNIEKRNVAKAESLLSTNVTKEQCCRLPPAGEKFYSDDDEPSVSESEKIKWRLRPHRCVTACHDGCTSFSKRCGESEVCRIRSKGIPKCLCNPLCSRNSLSYGGAICGSDGITYGHHCQLLRSNCRRNRSTRVLYYGECQAYSCVNVTCPQEGAHCFVDQYNRPKCLVIPDLCFSYEPVCGTDGQTYRSVCHMTQHNLKSGTSVRVSYHSQCTETKSCADDTECMKCLYNAATRNHVCITTRFPTCQYANNFPQVCGTDGKTYSSECALQQHSYSVGLYITVLHAAACNATTEEIIATGIQIDNPDRPLRVDEQLAMRISQQNSKTAKKNKNKHKRRAAKMRRALKHHL